MKIRTAHKSSKKLYEQCVKLEKLWSHAFTTTVPLTQRDTWYRKLREAIDREQNQAIWVSEAKVPFIFDTSISLLCPFTPFHQHRKETREIATHYLYVLCTPGSLSICRQMLNW